MQNQELVREVQHTCHKFCAALTKDEVSKFVHYVRVIRLEPQQILADVGHVGDSFYMVLEGATDLFQVEGDEEFSVGQIAPGGLVGEMSFFDRRPRTLRLRAHKDGVRLLEIQRSMYHRMRIEEPYISTNLLEFVIRSLDELVRTLSAQNANLNTKVRRSTIDA